MKKQKRNSSSGITLIALVISIIIMLILAGVSLNATVGQNGILGQAQLSTIMSRFASYLEQLELNALDDDEVYASGDSIKNYIPTMDQTDIDKFVIMKRNLMYISDNELEKQAASNLGIATAETQDGNTATAFNEVKAVIGGVVNLSSNTGEGFRVPTDDFDVTTNTNNSAEGLVGIRLYDKNSINDRNWNIVIEYDKDNQEVNRYGSGYYWLKAGETYIIDGETMTFENDFIVDYANKQYILLSGRAVNWNLNTTLGVSENLVLNIDPLSLSEGQWITNATDSNFEDFYVTDSRTGRTENKQVQKTGDVEYNSSNKSLVFNKSESNTAGEGGYLKLIKTGVDFTNGFTFEMYMNLSRGRYRKSNGNTALGLFCREPYMGYTRDYEMRFGMASSNTVGKFSKGSSLTTAPGDLIQCDSWQLRTGNADFTLNQNVYLTAVFTAYTQENLEAGILDEYQIENEWTKYEYYIDGELVHYGYGTQETYEEGSSHWNNDNCPFFIGTCNWNSDTDYFYLQGDVFATRLYMSPINADDVKLNYDTTLKYRSSF